MATLSSNGLVNHLVDKDSKATAEATTMSTEPEKVELKEVPIIMETTENVPLDTPTVDGEKPADVKKEETKSKTASLTRFFQRDRSKSADKKSKKEKGDAAEHEKLVEGAQTEETPVFTKEAAVVATEQPKKEERHVVKKPQWFQKKVKAPKAINNDPMMEHTDEAVPKPPRQPLGATMTVGLNMLDRDEKLINEHVKLQFDDIFGEPDGYHSVDCVWRLVFILFTRTSACFYKFLALLCAIPAAILWALFFALLTCCNIWCCLPTGKALSIVCAWPLKAWRFIVRGCLDPCFRSVGLMFGNCGIHHHKHDAFAHSDTIEAQLA